MVVFCIFFGLIKFKLSNFCFKLFDVVLVVLRQAVFNLRLFLENVKSILDSTKFWNLFSYCKLFSKYACVYVVQFFNFFTRCFLFTQIYFNCFKLLQFQFFLVFFLSFQQDSLYIFRNSISLSPIFIIFIKPLFICIFNSFLFSHNLIYCINNVSLLLFFSAITNYVIGFKINLIVYLLNIIIKLW